MLIPILWLLLGLVLLLFGGDYFVKAAAGIANRLGIAPLVIGLTVVAFGTSAPELFVTGGAALRGSSDFAIGNIVGSNLFNLLVVIGIGAAVIPIGIKRQTLTTDLPVMILGFVLFYYFSSDFLITRVEGMILFAILIAYLLKVFMSDTKPAVDEEELSGMKASLPICILVVTLSLAAMVYSADLVVVNASLLAKSIGISDFVISATLAAVGTSLAELATTLAAVRQRQTDLIIGNAVGSNIFNVFCVIGLTSIVQPVGVLPSVLSFDFIVMIAAAIIFFLVVLQQKVVSRWFGVAMLLCYVAYVVKIVVSDV